MKQKVIGIYEAGYYQIELILREGTGGEYYLIPEKGKCPRIKVGADYINWVEVVSALLHEVEEFLIDRMQCRYSPFDNLSNTLDEFTFLLNHSQFSDVCVKTAEYISKALPDLSKAWNEWKKNKKKDEAKKTTKVNILNDISENTLKTVYSSIQNFRKGRTGKRLDFEKYKKYLEEE